MKKCPKCGTEYPDTNTLCPSDGVALEKTSDTLLGKTLAGKYRIEARLSEGGMGTVYRGTHVLMDKTVAVKVLRPSLAADEKIVARFSREARAASRISHPHALSVTDFGEAEDGVVFLVMEYLDGQTLKEIIREDGPMALPRAVEILRQVGGALDAAHTEGVVHRDLKSDNIMLLSSSGTDYAKVLDFGIAKIKEADGAYDPGLTAPDLVIGTPQYMSPEQCSQSPDIDARSDIYSLGVILYELLVGHVPFTGDSPTSIMLKHLQEPAPSVLDERDDLPSAVSSVINRALAKKPEDRYQTVNELLEDFTIAAGMNPESDSPSAGHKRVAMPPPVYDSDEETLVRKRYTTPMVPPPVPTEMPPPASSFSPWKILVPSVIGLLLIFGLIFVLTRNSQTSPGELQPGTTLAADPNSQPVEAASPATGQSEAGIPVGGVTNPNATPNADASPSPSPANQAPGEVIEPEPSPTPTETPRRNPAIPTPVPTRSPTDEPPAPSPAATKAPVPKPTAAAPGATPPGDQ
ncbi:MAG TPA: protein kinase [Pyrinomonadaceae bacterium]|nr:protein kinase [Pyrinomonadaceae bacterium]